MKVGVKTLKGGKFPIEVDENATIATVKTIIETADPNLPADSLKVIYSGKILKDTDLVSAVGIKENEFFVAMAVPKKKSAAAAAPKETKEETPKKEEAKKEEAKPAESPSAPPAAEATATTTPAPSSTATEPPAAPTQPTIPDDVVQNLTTMGFPEEAVRHCLRVAQGNPDLAVEFLTNGIPEGAEQALQQAASQASATPGASGGTSSNQPLQALRNHPQFNDLRRLVQTNPQMLQQVLAQIGQQQPELLQEINSNQALFLQMMNEPITESSSTAATTGSSSTTAPSSGGGSSGAAPRGANPFGGMGNPMEMAQMIQSMDPAELNQMAMMMGITPDQLRMTAQMIGSMPPEQLNNFLMQSMGGEMPSGAGGGGGGPQVLRLSDEEMAAVDRLTEMGFDRAEAAQAFLACDKNEAMAANLLMDTMMNDGGGAPSGGGGGGGSGPSGGSGSGGNNNEGGGGDDDEEMYD